MIGCLGVIPGTVAFVFIGASTAGTMNEEVGLLIFGPSWGVKGFMGDAMNCTTRA